MLRAQRSITIVGWDIDSRTPLVGRCTEPEDGFPTELRPFLRALAQRNARLCVNILLWDYASIYALERESFPLVKLNWDGANLVLDNCLPLGSSQHQKIVVIDDCLAFTGGLDLTIRRWDTAEHRLSHRFRFDPGGEAYGPFHDIQAVVDGAAATALAELVRARWRCASGEDLPTGPRSNLWPEGVAPDFHDVDVGISRTAPDQDGMAEAREVKQLFFDMIDAAQDALYIENQFLTSLAIARRIRDRLVANPRLEVLIIAPQTHQSWLEAAAMRHGRSRFQQIIADAGAGDRVRFAYPKVTLRDKSTAVMVHSKVMIVDDRLLRIGSANLNNRSMGADSECDLVIEAGSPRQREAISRIRSRLLAMHCGVSEAAMAAALLPGSLISASRRLSSERHSLADIDGERDGADYPEFLDAIADPERPIDAASMITFSNGERHSEAKLRAATSLSSVAVLMLLLATAWTFNSTQTETIVREALDLSATHWSTPFVAIAAFVVGGALMVPVTVLIVAASASLGMVWGMIYAALGTLVSSLVFYGLGAWLGRGAVRRLMGGRLAKVRNMLRRRGVIAIAAVRMVPVAPFSFVNLAAGATGVGLWPFVLGTVLGMAPGFIILSALGGQLYRLVSEPSLISIATLFALVLLWLAGIFAVQYWVRRHLGP